jgi:hypothetical protein
MIWEGLIVTRGPFNMFQNILDLFLVFSKILETLILDFLESNNILGETQGAFRKDRRIEDQIFSLQGIVQKGHLARLYQRPLIDPKKPNKEVFLKICIGMQYPVKKIVGLQFFYLFGKHLVK